MEDKIQEKQLIQYLPPEPDFEGMKKYGGREWKMPEVKDENGKIIDPFHDYPDMTSKANYERLLDGVASYFESVIRGYQMTVATTNLRIERNRRAVGELIINLHKELREQLISKAISEGRTPTDDEKFALRRVKQNNDIFGMPGTGWMKMKDLLYIKDMFPVMEQDPDFKWLPSKPIDVQDEQAVRDKIVKEGIEFKTKYEFPWADTLVKSDQRTSLAKIELDLDLDNALILERIRQEDREGTKGVTGVIKHKGQIICSTVERPWEDNRPTISCIPAGIFPLKVLSSSNKFSYPHIWIMDVPDRDGIKMHIANNPNELEGCIAPGKESTDNNNWVIESTDNLKHLIDYIQQWKIDTLQVKIV
jgi:hypothetical protein